MQESNALPERIYGLAVADGRRTVRPNETIGLVFRIRNTLTGPTPHGRTTFTIPPGWTALDPVEAEFPEIAAGAAYVHAIAVRADVADDAASGAFQVALALPDGTLASNRVRIAVRGRPRFEAPRSMLSLTLGDAPDTVRACVVLVNEGDATARDVQVCVPAPPGFALASGTHMYAAGDVAPGASVACSLTFRATAPPSTAVRIDDARVDFAGGAAALTCATDLVLEPYLLSPVVTLERNAARLDVAVAFGNIGVLAARDHRARIAMSPGWRIARATTTLAGAPAATRQQDDALLVELPLLPAQRTIGLRFTASARNARAAGTLDVAWAGGNASVTIPPAERRHVVLCAQAARAWVAVGTPLAVELLLWNDGETDETIAVSADGASVARLELRSGSCAVRRFDYQPPSEARSGDELALGIAAHRADGEVLGATSLPLRVYGCSTASAPEDAPPDTRPAQIEAHWEAVTAAHPGAPFQVTLRCRFDADVDACTIRPSVAAARYVAGSTRINGHALIDGAAEPPLFSAAGLRINGIAAESEIAIDWSLVPDGSGELVLEAAIDADGTHVTSHGPRVSVAALGPFVQRPDGLPFHVDAPLIEQPPMAALTHALAAPAPHAIRLGVRLDAARRTTILRMLRGTRGEIVAHLPLLAAIFPDTIAGADAQLLDALALAGESVRSLYERLFVKLRIPGYDVGPYDLEDAATRSAIVGLLDLLATAAPPETASTADLNVSLDRATLLDVRERLANAPLGGVAAVGAMTLLLPRDGANSAAAALGAYAKGIAQELAAVRSLAHDAFAAYLGMHALDVLDSAREDAIAALAAVTESEVT